MYDMDMSIQQFSALYEENPCKLYKIVVGDRTQFKPNHDETRLLEPAALQEDIDAAIAKVTEGKAFVRPSGTEDILRLYAEAKTVEQMEQLGQEIIKVIETKYNN